MKLQVEFQSYHLSHQIHKTFHMKFRKMLSNVFPINGVPAQRRKIAHFSFSNSRVPSPSFLCAV